MPLYLVLVYFGLLGNVTLSLVTPVNPIVPLPRDER